MHVELLKAHLRELEIEHKELNDIIGNPDSAREFSEFTLQRLKKRKLALKDKITKLKTTISPDLIA